MRDFSTLRILPRSGRTACVERSRPCLAEPPAESPSTMKISAISGSLTMQSASLPGRPMPPMADLRAVSRALRAAARAREASTALRMTALASFGFSSRNSASFAFTTDSTKPCMPGLPSLVFVWPSNCGSVSLAEMTADRPSRMSSPSSALSFSLRRPWAARVAVDRARQRRAEAGEVRAALVRVDVVREREHRLLIGAVPLHRDLDRALVALALEEDDLLLDRVLVLVDVADEILDPALVVELLGLRALAALVGDRDPQAAGQERRLAQALLERRVLEGQRLEDVGVRAEVDRRAGLRRRRRPGPSGPAGAPRT